MVAYSFCEPGRDFVFSCLAQLEVSLGPSRYSLQILVNIVIGIDAT